MGNPFFSVIIPTHRREKSLDVLLESLEAQTLSANDFEVIVVPSPGDTILEEESIYQGTYRFNLTIVEPLDEKNYAQNVSLKRNQGLELSKANWLAFTDDDCICDPHWLEEAKKLIELKNPVAIEGNTQIPDSPKITLTYKGLKRLELPCGYQTCNIFYRRDILKNIGGFDKVNFPWYLEDSDVAWSVLENYKEIVFGEKCIVFHPNKEPAPWRLLHEARGAKIKVLLYKKHREIFQNKKMKIMRANYYLYLLFYLIVLVGLLTLNWILLVTGIVLSLGLLSVHMLKLFRGCQTSNIELLETAYYTALVPPVTLIYLLKGLKEQKVKIADMIYLLTV